MGELVGVGRQVLEREDPSGRDNQSWTGFRIPGPPAKGFKSGTVFEEPATTGSLSEEGRRGSGMGLQSVRHQLGRSRWEAPGARGPGGEGLVRGCRLEEPRAGTAHERREEALGPRPGPARRSPAAPPLRRMSSPCSSGGRGTWSRCRAGWWPRRAAGC